MDLVFEGVTGWLVLQQFVLPFFLPAIVGYVSTRVTSARVQALSLLGLSAVTSLLTNMLNAYSSGDATFDLGLALVMTATTFFAGVAAHYGFLKPTGITAKALDSGRTDGRHEA